FVRLAIVASMTIGVLSGIAHAQTGKSDEARPRPATKGPTAPQVITREGVSVEFSIEPLSTGDEDEKKLLAGTDATIRFKIKDVNAGKVLSNLKPAGWIDRRDSNLPLDPRECRQKVQSFLQPDFNRGPVNDLNVYFILALNNEPNISVLDPLGGFGGSRLYTLINLRSPGEDWVMSADKKRLYVSMPQVNQVAVIDTQMWKVIADIDAGTRPSRVALQHDGRYLWVGNDDASDTVSGVTVIDTVEARVAARIKTGLGHHEIAFTEDDRLAFVTNKLNQTVSVIDVRKLAVVSSIKVGLQPSSIAFSTLSKAVYVANEGDGTISVVDPGRLSNLTTVRARPGLGRIRIPSEGRCAFVLNRTTSEVYILDLSSNRLLHSIKIGLEPDQIGFTREFAYVRSASSEFVAMIKLRDLDKVGQGVALTWFPAGQRAPKASRASSLGDLIVAAPEEGAVLVANPADKTIFYYTEGMGAPMGSFDNYRRDPRALMVLDNSLLETTHGVYQTTVRLGAPGHYDVAFLLDSPRVVSCFDLEVADNPALPKQIPVALKMQPATASDSNHAIARVAEASRLATARVGKTYKLRFELIDPASGKAKTGLGDVEVLVFLAPGIWQERQLAKAIGNDVYEIAFVPPQPGAYYVFFRCASLGLQFNQLSPVVIEASQ